MEIQPPTGDSTTLGWSSGCRTSAREFMSCKPARAELGAKVQGHSVIDGIARDLMYLHEDSRLKIIHCDLKPGNILPDGDMNSKILDFNLAKLFAIDLSAALTYHPAGTR
ncbi:hypothetical protein PVAP13_3NG012600 [Panicum virgatum]|uniref:non-specific serine/threonine protein kinase n=1 Tax=Panicum virgatum TaxID=38727 RepID=A0A8T0U1V8_PANVG|nr:hypothetical protein PVAP13_3NG012600 [Panicum virgatum]